jgi:hypothetical protein
MEHIDQLPFDPKLPIKDVESPFGINEGRLHSLGDSYVIRRFPLELAEAEQRLPPDERLQATRDVREHRLAIEKNADAFFKKLHAEYGTRVAQYWRVVGKDTEADQEATYAVVEKINGSELDRVTPEELLRYQEQINRTFAGLFRLLSDVLTRGGTFHSELWAMQFRVGTSARDPSGQPDVYLIDIDPLLFEYQPETNEEFLVPLAYTLLKLVGDTEILMNKVQPNVLIGARQAAEAAVRILKAKNNPDIDAMITECKRSKIVTSALESHS